jgi:hypothetical protein
LLKVYENIRRSKKKRKKNWVRKTKQKKVRVNYLQPFSQNHNKLIIRPLLILLSLLKFKQETKILKNNNKENIKKRFLYIFLP